MQMVQDQSKQSLVQKDNADEPKETSENIEPETALKVISPQRDTPSAEKSKSSSKMHMHKGELTLNSNAPKNANQLARITNSATGNNQSQNMTLNEQTEQYEMEQGHSFAEPENTNFNEEEPEISEAANYLEEFTDKEFEENFGQLVDRLNANLWEHNRKDLLVSKIKDEIENNKIEKAKKDGTYGAMLHAEKKKKMAVANQSPFKASHISYLQALASNREQYAQRLKQYD